MNPLRILYVEDEPDIRTIATLSMTSLGGFSVRIAPGIPVYSVDSAESLEKWKEGPTHVER